MARVVSRRKLLSSGIKTGLGLVALRDLSFDSGSMIVKSLTGQKSSESLRGVFERLDQFAARHMNEVGAPGMVIAIADARGLLRASQYGFADLKAGIRVAPQTLFQIGSISKSLVAIAALQLVEESKLALHKPEPTICPGLKSNQAMRLLPPITYSATLQVFRACRY